MVRELANYRPPDYAGVLRWPLREALISYRVKMAEAARVQFRHDVAVWAQIAVHSSKKSEPPKVPKILRGPN
jgi:hypothetical protein